MQAFVDKFKVGTRASQAQSRLKAMQRLEVVAEVMDDPYAASALERSTSRSDQIRSDQRTALPRPNLLLTHCGSCWNRGLRFAFPDPEPLAPPVLQLLNVGFGYPGRQVMMPLSTFSIPYPQPTSYPAPINVDFGYPTSAARSSSAASSSVSTWRAAWPSWGPTASASRRCSR